MTGRLGGAGYLRFPGHGPEIGGAVRGGAGWSCCNSGHIQTDHVWNVKQNLAGGFKHFLFSIIYGIILPID